jgi:protein TonB
MTLSGTLEMYSQFPNEPEKAPLSERFIVVGLVVLMHLSVFASYYLQPESPVVLVNEMSISFANMQMQQADVIPQPKPKPREPEPVPSEEPAVKEVAPPVKQEASPQSPVILDDEPIFSADYLKNPKPSYPMVAKRMGYQGRVLLNVEVLPDGKAREVVILQSSGYNVLDNAAIQTVKTTWRFVPGHRFGQAVTQWVHVPIKFELEG